MKILIINNALGYGGAEKQVVVDANYLTKNKHQVTVAYEIEGELKNLLLPNINKFKLKYRSSILSFFQLFLHLIKNKYDIIHAHQYWAAKVAGIPGKLTGHKVIINEHGLGLWRKWYHSVIVWFISLFANKVITTCDENTRLRHEMDKIPISKLLTVYNSFELIEEKNINNIKKVSNFWIGFVGRFNKIKQLDIFIDICIQLKKEIDDFKIVLVGDGKEKERILQLIEQNNLCEYFILPGFCKHPKQYYRLFDVFVLPSKIEAFSLALLEAGASSIPLIAFDVGGNNEIIKNGETGYIVEPFNTKIITDKIHDLYINKQKCKKMGDKAREYICSNFSIANRIIKLEQIYSEYM